MKRTILSLAASLACLPATAATYYISDCQSGAHPSCVAGNDGSGTPGNPATPLQTWAGVPALSAGDQVLWAKGGAWTGFSITLSGGTSRSNPIVWDSYAPSWGGSAKPIITATPGSDAVFIQSGQGYSFNNLSMQGNGSGNAFYIYGNSGTVEGFKFSGMTLNNFNAGLFCTRGSVSPQYVRVVGSTITNSSANGILSNCFHTVIEYNTFDNNGSGSKFDHHIYLDGDVAEVYDVTIRGNTLTRNGKNVQCGSVAIVAHGVKRNITIENNFVDQSDVTTNGECFGIEVAAGYGAVEYFRNINIRGNRVIANGMTTGINCSSCVRAFVENNVIVTLGSGDFSGINIGEDGGAGDDASANITMRNNSVYITNATGGADSKCFAVRGAASTHTIVSNLCYMAAGSGVPTGYFLNGRNLSSQFTAFNNNLTYRASGTGNWSDMFSTLANAQAAGIDVNGLSSNPLLVATPAAGNNWSMQIQSGSPAKNAGHATLSAPNSIYGYVRGAQIDIGAHKQGAPK